MNPSVRQNTLSILLATLAFTWVAPHAGAGQRGKPREMKVTRAYKDLHQRLVGKQAIISTLYMSVHPPQMIAKIIKDKEVNVKSAISVLKNKANDANTQFPAEQNSYDNSKEAKLAYGKKLKGDDAALFQLWHIHRNTVEVTAVILGTTPEKLHTQLKRIAKEAKLSGIDLEYSYKPETTSSSSKDRKTKTPSKTQVQPPSFSANKTKDNRNAKETHILSKTSDTKSSSQTTLSNMPKSPLLKGSEGILEAAESFPNDSEEQNDLFNFATRLERLEKRKKSEQTKPAFEFEHHLNLGDFKISSSNITKKIQDTVEALAKKSEPSAPQEVIDHVIISDSSKLGNTLATGSYVTFIRTTKKLGINGVDISKNQNWAISKDIPLKVVAMDKPNKNNDLFYTTFQVVQKHSVNSAINKNSSGGLTTHVKLSTGDKKSVSLHLQNIQ